MILLALLFVACKREIDFELSGPSLLATPEGTVEIVQEPGFDVFLNFSIQAAAGLSEFTVRRDGEPFDARTYTDEISDQYNFEYTVPEDEEVGTENVFTFEVYDQEGRNTSYTLKVTVRRSFSEVSEVINGTAVTTVRGRVNNDYTFTADNVYMIDSTFSIENNSTLTIAPGSTVYFKTYGDNNLVSRLTVSRGARLVAIGTAEQPIVFTSDKVLLGQAPEPTDWGGIMLYGHAPTNQGSVILDNGYRYGGNVPADNSGTLRYVRIEYAGKNGLHALSMNGVGSGTSISHVQVFRTENIAFRIRGGRVSLKHIAGIGHGAYGIWAEHGWQGNGQFWLFQTDVQASLAPVNFWNQARSIEMRNDESNFTLQPRTQFRIANVTLIGNGYTGGVANGTRRGLRIRRGAFGTFQNALVTQFPDEGTRIEDLAIETLGNSMIMDNLRSYGNRIDFGQEAESFFYASGNYNILNTSTSGVTLSNFVGSESSSFNPSSMGSFFSSAPYIGAVESTANDWTAIGNWFKNLDGTIR